MIKILRRMILMQEISSIRPGVWEMRLGIRWESKSLMKEIDESLRYRRWSVKVNAQWLTILILLLEIWLVWVWCLGNILYNNKLNDDEFDSNVWIMIENYNESLSRSIRI